MAVITFRDTLSQQDPRVFVAKILAALRQLEMAMHSAEDEVIEQFSRKVKFRGRALIVADESKLRSTLIQGAPNKREARAWDDAASELFFYNLTRWPRSSRVKILAYFEGVLRNPGSSLLHPRARHYYTRTFFDYTFPLVNECLMSGHHKIREQAGEAVEFMEATMDDVLGSQGDTRATDYCLQEFSDENALIRAVSAEIIGNVCPSDCVSKLLPLLADRSGNVRLVTAWALGMLRARDAVPELIRSLEDEHDENVQLVVAEALGFIGDESAIPALERRTPGLFNHRRRGLRRACLTAIRQLEGQVLD